MIHQGAFTLKISLVSPFSRSLNVCGLLHKRSIYWNTRNCFAILLSTTRSYALAMDQSSMHGLYSTIENTGNTTDDLFNHSMTTSHNEVDYQQLEISRLLVIISFPIIIVIGTIGNLLTFIIMQRGSLKHSSTCFYMAMLAVADTS